MNNQQLNKKGFTLIETMTVVAIISVLAVIILQSANAFRIKARDSQRIIELNYLSNALDQYYSEHAFYPPHYGEPLATGNAGYCSWPSDATGHSGIGYDCIRDGGLTCSVCTGECRDASDCTKDRSGKSYDTLKQELAPYIPTISNGPAHSSSWITYVYTTSVRTDTRGDSDPSNDTWTDYANQKPQRYCVGTFLEDPHNPKINNPTATWNSDPNIPSCDKFYWGCGANYYICSKEPDVP